MRSIADAQFCLACIRVGGMHFAARAVAPAVPWYVLFWDSPVHALTGDRGRS